jgi:hypothetical protein
MKAPVAVATSLPRPTNSQTSEAVGFAELNALLRK